MSSIGVANRPAGVDSRGAKPGKPAGPGKAGNLIASGRGDSYNRTSPAPQEGATGKTPRTLKESRNEQHDDDGPDGHGDAGHGDAHDGHLADGRPGRRHDRNEHGHGAP